jgi:hypothetical protein
MTELQPSGKNISQGSISPVPIRTAGNNEIIFDKNRCRYGEDPRFIIPQNVTNNLIESNPNDIPTKRNATMRDNLILNPLSGYGRGMSQ